VGIVFSTMLGAAIFYAILCFTGVTVTACLPSVGGLLAYSLIINQAAAYQLTYSLRRRFLLAALFGVASCEAGLLLAYCLDLPAGASIVLVSSALFVLCAALSPKRGRVGRTLAHPRGSTETLKQTKPRRLPCERCTCSSFCWPCFSRPLRPLPVCR
jgi:hypothetical protein